MYFLKNTTVNAQLNLPHLFVFSRICPAGMLWEILGDQAATTAPAEATERWEEEPTADQHSCNSQAGRNESKGTL